MKERMHQAVDRMHHVATNYAVLGVLLFGHTRVWRIEEAGAVSPRLAMTYPVVFNSFAGSDPAESGMCDRLHSAMKAVERTIRDIENSVPVWH